jgi:hypothetical protein
MAAAGRDGLGAEAAHSRDEEPGSSKWAHLVGFRTGVGYKDNVTLAHESPEESVFLATGVDYFALRLPEGATRFDFHLIADESRFLSADAVDAERVAIAQARLRTDAGGGWETTIGLETIYQDQVLDVSVTETDLRTVQVEGLTLTGRPGVKRTMNRWGWVQLEVPVRRQWFRSPLDDYWEFGPEVSWGIPYGHRSEASLSYEFMRRGYDADESLTAQGAFIPGRTRAFERHEVGARWRHHWDAARRWRTTTRLSWLMNRDNGGGYFDYDRARLSQQARFEPGAWAFLVGMRLSFYDYRLQTASPFDGGRRERLEWSLEARVERRLARFVKVHLGWEREETFSNLTLDEYSVNVVTAGLDWEF